MQTNAIRIHEFGGADVLRWESIDLPAPGPGEARIRHTAIGLNFIDTYHRDGLYPVPLPTVLGREAAGVVEALGDGVTEVALGDRVVYSGGPLGAYSERRNYPVDTLIPLPDSVDDELAAAICLKGLTAWYLVHRSYAIRPGDTVLLYAAAGGVGSLASQWAKKLGATVIGIVSSEEKAERATAQGCDHVVYSRSEDIPGQVKAKTGGAGVAAVYDSVGRDTFMQSLDCLRPHGVMVSFGNASGAVEPFAPAELAKRGSLYLTRPILEHFVETRDKLLDAATELFEFIAAGRPIVHIGQRYSLADAAEAHRDLQARRTLGSTLLLP